MQLCDKFDEGLSERRRIREVLERLAVMENEESQRKAILNSTNSLQMRQSP